MSPTLQAAMTEPKTLVAYWGSAYLFVVAVLYLWGYWSPFRINVLEYISLADVVKAAAYPLATVFVFIALGALIGEAIFPEGFLPPGGGAKTRLGTWLRSVVPYIALAYGTATTLYFIFGSVDKWRVLPILIAIPVSVTLKEAGLLKTFLKSDRARSVVLFLLASLPPFAYGQGTLKAHQILTGTDYIYVTSEIGGQSFDAKSKIETRLRYVGKAGDQYFLFAPKTRSMLIVPLSEAKILELVATDSKSTNPPFTPMDTEIKAPSSAASAP